MRILFYEYNIVIVAIPYCPIFDYTGLRAKAQQQICPKRPSQFWVSVIWTNAVFCSMINSRKSTQTFEAKEQFYVDLSELR